jgi:2-oxoglutarate ferredoxin oxidoreductase subunit beta
MLHRSAHHKGSSFMEIYQNCNIFNDGAFEIFTNKKTKPDETIFLEPGQPLTFGTEKNKGIKLDGLKPVAVNIDSSTSVNDLWIHDEKDIYKAQTLVRMFDDVNDDHHLPRPFGVFYDVERPCYEDLMAEQIAKAQQNEQVDLDQLLSGRETWEIKREKIPELV